MSLFEKIKNKRFSLTEQPGGGGFGGGFTDKQQSDTNKLLNKLFGDKGKARKTAKKAIRKSPTMNPTPDDVAGEKSIRRKIQKNQSKDINKRLSADLTRGDQARSQYNPDGGYGDSNVGDATQNKAQSQTPPKKTTPVKQSEVSKKAKKFTKEINKKRATVANYPKTREQLVSKRAEYGIDTQGKATKAGIEKFARRRKQSNLPLTKKDLAAAKKSMVGTGRKGADVGKYGGKLSKQRYVSDTTFKKIQKKINIKNPVKTSPVTGGPIPLKGKELKDYKQQQQQQQQPQSGSSTRTRTRTRTRTNTGNKSFINLQKEIEKIKKGLNNPVDKSFGDALKNNQTGIKTPPPNELEKIKPKVTSSKNLGKLSQTKLGSKVPSMQLSKRLMKQKNKYLVGAGLALAGGAYLLGRNRVNKAKEKEKKALIITNQKKSQKPKKVVDVNLFLNRTGTPPTKTSKPSYTSVYDKDYIKNLKSKTTTPKNNLISKNTSGVSNAARKSAALPYDPSKIASYAKSSMSSKNVKPPKPLNKKQSEKINQQVNKYVADRKVKS